MPQETVRKMISFNRQVVQQGEGQPTIEYVQGMLPTSNGYIPMPQMDPTSLFLLDITPTDERFSPVFLAIEHSSGNEFKLWAIGGTEYDGGGTQTTLAAHDTTSGAATTRALTAGTYSADGMWNFCQFGNLVIATNYQEAVQYIDVSAGTPAWADLITSTETPKAKFCAVIRNQVVLGGIDNTGGTPDGVFLDKLWWSAIDDAQNFDISETTQADFQRLLSVPGPITGLVGGEYGLIFKSSGIYRMDFVGAPLIYRFEEISSMWGTTYPRSIVKVDQDVFFISSFGPAVIRNGQIVEALPGLEDFWFNVSFNSAAGKPFYQLVDYTKSAIGTGNYAIEVGKEGQYVIGAFCPVSRIVFWWFPYGEAGGVNTTVIFAYHIDTGGWSLLSYEDWERVNTASDSGITYIPPTYNLEAPTTKNYPSIGISSVIADQCNLYQFNSANSQDAFLRTGLFRLEEDTKAKLLGARLVYSTYSSKHGLESTFSPISHSFTARTSESPAMASGEVTEETVESSSGNTEDFVPFVNLEGQWFQLETKINSHSISSEYLTNLIGVELWYIKESK